MYRNNKTVCQREERQRKRDVAVLESRVETEPPGWTF